MTIDTNVRYDFDVVYWDTVGGAYTPDSMKKASGGSEKEVVQLADALAKRDLHVLCLNQTREPYGPEGRTAYVGPTSTLYPGHWRWDNVDAARGVRCKTLIVQRYSTIPTASQVLADRIVVRATDVYGDYYKHQALTHLCVSEWQANAFRAAGFPVKVVPAMLDDDYYELASTPKVKGRFIYASAYMKGLPETLAKWKELRHRFPNEMRNCELHITSPGYGKLQKSPCDFNPQDENVVVMNDLPPRELAKYMATCEGLFYVNTFPETFCAVAAIAEAVGCRTHVLAKSGLAGIVEAAAGVGVTEGEEWFDKWFIDSLGVSVPKWIARDFRVSTVMPQWLAALHLTAEQPAWPTATELSEHPVLRSPHDMSDEEKGRLVGEPQERHIRDLMQSVGSLKRAADRMRAGLTDKERAILDSRVPVDTTFVPDPTKKNVGFYRASILGGKRGEIHDIQEIIKMQAEKKVPTVCLVMLAKNAESTLPRALESVKRFVDYAVFQFDDGPSSEKMRVIIDDVTRAAGKQLHWDYAYEPWINFSVNRNKLLEFARESAGGPFDYILALDADDAFVGLNEFDKRQLTLDCYEVDIHDFGGSKHYPRRVLWKNDGRFKYEWPAHECLTEGANQVSTGRLTGVHYDRLGPIADPKETQEQRNARTREKYLRDVRLFAAELERNPEETRCMYYLAQSLEDASCGTDHNLLRDALRGYRKRAEMSGYVEEKFISWMKVGQLCVRFREGEQSVVGAFRHAAEVIPARVTEAAYEMMFYYNQPENPGASKEKALAVSGEFPLSSVIPDGFLVDHEVYQWKYRLQHALALFFVGRKPEAKVIFEDLLTTAPAWIHPVLKANLGYCQPAVRVEQDWIEELKRKYGTVPPPALAIPPSNPIPPGETWAGQTRPSDEALVEGLERRRGLCLGLTVKKRREAIMTISSDFPPKSFPDPPAINYALEYARGTKNVEAEKHLKRLQDRSNAFGNGYGTHLPLLAAVVATAPPGDILELGTGNFSSPLLSTMCKAMGRMLHSVEEKEEWLFNIRDLEGPHHALWAASDPYDYMPTVEAKTSGQFAVVFIDQGRTNQDRMAALRYLQDRADFIVCHDTRNSWFAGVDEVLSDFKFRFDYCLMTPVTTVVSNKYDVSAFG